MAVFNSNPDLKAVPTQLSKSLKPGPKKDIVQRQVDPTHELGKYFPPEKPTLKKATSSTMKNVQPTKPGSETQVLGLFHP